MELQWLQFISYFWSLIVSFWAWYHCILMSTKLISLLYRLEKEGGPAHDRKFVCSVQVETQNGTFVTIGDPMSRVKDAENSAAQKMLELLLRLWDLFMYMARSFVNSFGKKTLYSSIPIIADLWNCGLCQLNTIYAWAFVKHHEHNKSQAISHDICREALQYNWHSLLLPLLYLQS